MDQGVPEPCLRIDYDSGARLGPTRAAWEVTGLRAGAVLGASSKEAGAKQTSASQAPAVPCILSVPGEPHFFLRIEGALISLGMWWCLPLLWLCTELPDPEAQPNAIHPPI